MFNDKNVKQISISMLHYKDKQRPPLSPETASSLDCLIKDRI